MIHHLARAFLVRDAALQRAAASHDGSASDGKAPAPTPSAKPVKARPITPWSVPTRQAAQGLGGAASAVHASRRVRICTDPSDARRTVIAGRFAEVCAALDRLVREQEATA